MGAWAGHRQYNLPLGTISVEVDAKGGSMHVVDVKPSEAKKIAQLGNVPEELFPQFKDSLDGLLLMFSIESISRDKDIGPEFTRRQLLTELDKLSRLPLDAEIPEIKPRLMNELQHIEIVRLLQPTWGPHPIRIKNNVDRANADAEAAGRAAELRVQRSLTDVRELRALASDVQREVSGWPESSREYDARKRALDPARRCIADHMISIWTGMLGRPLKVTKPLITMTWAVYEGCRVKGTHGGEMGFDAVKQQLHESARRRRGEGESAPS